MHHAPGQARDFLAEFLSSYQPVEGRAVWMFPSTVALEAVADAIADRDDVVAGAQNIHWESSGAFTGELSAPMAKMAGATAALVGHSERRHVFGETDDETVKKVRALLEHDLRPVLCVGETLRERQDGQTLMVVERQLSVLEGHEAEVLNRIVVAYEPVWAIGTGKTATPQDAATVHAGIRDWLVQHGAVRDEVSVLYGGSVKPANAGDLLRQREIDGLLVGGASLDPISWGQICHAGSID